MCGRWKGTSVRDMIWIGVGAIAGANARYLVSQFLGHRFQSDFPFGTFLINISGSLVIGIVLTLLTEQFLTDPHWRLVLVGE